MKRMWLLYFILLSNSSVVFGSANHICCLYQPGSNLSEFEQVQQLFNNDLGTDDESTLTEDDDERSPVTACAYSKMLHTKVSSCKKRQKKKKKAHFFTKIPPFYPTGTVFKTDLKLIRKLQNDVDMIPLVKQMRRKRLTEALIYCYMGYSYKEKNPEINPLYYLTSDYIFYNEGDITYLPGYNEVFPMMAAYCYAFVFKKPFPLKGEDKHICDSSFTYKVKDE